MIAVHFFQEDDRKPVKVINDYDWHENGTRIRRQTEIAFTPDISKLSFRDLNCSATNLELGQAQV
ncbi:MAG: hypothetical protein HPM95_11875 [Alphaproteobacteria bacterium]|nr:hypothetical protein [Alphaproteobacteria bacterium]